MVQEEPTHCALGGYQMHKLEDIQNQNHPEVGHTHKESTETKKTGNPSIQKLSRPVFMVPGGLGHLQVPWE